MPTKCVIRRSVTKQSENPSNSVQVCIRQTDGQVGTNNIEALAQGGSSSGSAPADGGNEDANVVSNESSSESEESNQEANQLVKHPLGCYADKSTLPSPEWKMDLYQDRNQLRTCWVSPVRKIAFKLNKDALVFEEMKRKVKGDEYKAWITYTKRCKCLKVARRVIASTSYDIVETPTGTHNMSHATLQGRLESFGWIPVPSVSRVKAACQWLSPDYKIRFLWRRLAYEFELLRQDCQGDESKALSIFLKRKATKKLSDFIKGGLPAVELLVERAGGELDACFAHEDSSRTEKSSKAQITGKRKAQITGKRKAQITGKREAQITGKRKARITGKRKARVTGKRKALITGKHKMAIRGKITEKLSTSSVQSEPPRTRSKSANCRITENSKRAIDDQSIFCRRVVKDRVIKAVKGRRITENSKRAMGDQHTRCRPAVKGCVIKARKSPLRKMLTTTPSAKCTARRRLSTAVPLASCCKKPNVDANNKQQAKSTASSNEDLPLNFASNKETTTASNKSQPKSEPTDYGDFIRSTKLPTASKATSVSSKLGQIVAGSPNPIPKAIDLGFFYRDGPRRKTLAPKETRESSAPASANVSAMKKRKRGVSSESRRKPASETEYDPPAKKPNTRASANMSNGGTTSNNPVQQLSAQAKPDTAAILIPLMPVKKRIARSSDGANKNPNSGIVGRASKKCTNLASAKVARPTKKTVVAKPSVAKHTVLQPSTKQARERLRSKGWEPQHHRTTQLGQKCYLWLSPKLKIKFLYRNRAEEFEQWRKRYKDEERAWAQFVKEKQSNGVMLSTIVLGGGRSLAPRAESGPGAGGGHKGKQSATAVETRKGSKKKAPTPHVEAVSDEDTKSWLLELGWRTMRLTLQYDAKTKWLSPGGEYQLKSQVAAEEFERIYQKIGRDLSVRGSEKAAWEQFKREQDRKGVELSSVAYVVGGAGSKVESYPEPKRKAVTIVTPERNRQIQKQRKIARGSSSDDWAAKYVDHVNSLDWNDRKHQCGGRVKSTSKK